MYAVLFNGPPQSGKDTVSQMLVEHMDQRITTPTREVSLSTPLRRIAYQMIGLTYCDDSTCKSCLPYEEFKQMSFHEFGGITGRQIMIDVSESFLKPKYGREIMAKMLIESQANFDGLLLIRDTGFQFEVDELISAFGEKNCYVVRVHREGKDFSADSREWVRHQISSHEMPLYNDGTLDDLRIEAGRIYGRLVNQMGWRL